MQAQICNNKKTITIIFDHKYNHPRFMTIREIKKKHARKKYENERNQLSIGNCCQNRTGPFQRILRDDILLVIQIDKSVYTK